MRNCQVLYFPFVKIESNNPANPSIDELDQQLPLYFGKMQSEINHLLMSGYRIIAHYKLTPTFHSGYVAVLERDFG